MDQAKKNRPYEELKTYGNGKLMLESGVGIASYNVLKQLLYDFNMAGETIFIRTKSFRWSVNRNIYEKYMLTSKPINQK